MKILSINRDHTKSESSVAFDVDVAPDDKALAMVLTGRVIVSYTDGVLIFNASQSDQRILMNDVGEFLDAYTRNEQLLAKQASEAEREHDHMLREISSRLNLPVGKIEAD